MRNKTVTVGLFLALLIGTTGCKNTCNNTTPNNNPAIGANNHYLDLREPIYLVLEESLWSECDNYLRSTADCQNDVEVAVRAGIDDWSKHFYKPYQPDVVIVFSQEDVLADTVNTPIHLSMEEGVCDEIILQKKIDSCASASNKTEFAACYIVNSNSVKIIFNDQTAIRGPTMAHEFGHALGLDHRLTTFSIMSYGKGNRVLPIDMITMCELHKECPPHDETWCEGSFFDSCRCPSDSFEDGEAKRVEEGLVCE